MPGQDPLDPPDPPKKGPRDYLDYVNDAELARVSVAYQTKYSENPRESDKRTAQLLLQSLRSMQPMDHRPRILDIGCSTGNFLRHLKRLNVNADLVGGDLMKPMIEQCRNDEHLSGVDFQLMDVLSIPRDKPFDIITANAVNVYFEPALYGMAMHSIAHALKPGGYFIAYEWVHNDLAERQIVENSEWHPNGIIFWFRSHAFVSLKLQEAGFDKIDIQRFDIPIDLPRPLPGEGLVSHTTIEPGTGRRLIWRGELYQPWAHIVAKKPRSPR